MDFLRAVDGSWSLLAGQICQAWCASRLEKDVAREECNAGYAFLVEEVENLPHGFNNLECGRGIDFSTVFNHILECGRRDDLI